MTIDDIFELVSEWEKSAGVELMDWQRNELVDLIYEQVGSLSE